MKYNFRKKLILFAVILGSFPFFSDAFSIEKINDTPILGNFSVFPAKSELNLKRGENASKTVTVSNNTGKKMNFEISFEDFIPSLDDDNPIQFGKSGKDTSLKSFINTDKKNFSLEEGEKAILNVNINIPKKISSGGLFGAVIISANSPEDTGGTAKVLVEVPSLFFIRIIGNENPAGDVTDFKYKKGIFSIMFENQGNVHLNPTGEIELKNILGQTVDKIPVIPWYVLPVSSRLNDIAWKNVPDNYLYEADLKLSPGFGDKNDVINKKIWIYSLSKTLSIVVFVFVVILLGGLIKYLRK